ncbi:MAG: LysR family transcriptional regulator [Pseudonocardiaceae bacterium]|nr:LysR family transcriptional regulator [Pseudonocardiaceae bacterium]
MDDLEVRELRYFVAVAEELNFSRAAKRLGIAQPPLSRAIRQVESRLGVQLLVRDTRQVSLTDAGTTLLGEARRILEVVSAAAHRTRRAALSAPPLAITAKPAVATALLSRVLETYRGLPDQPRIDLIISGYGEQDEMVRTGKADLALIGGPFNDTGLDNEPLSSEPRVAVLPIGHELTRRSELHCRDLTGLPTPQWPAASPAQRAYWAGQDRDFSGTRSIQPPDFLPVTGPVATDTAQLLEVVSLGQAVALIPRSVAERNPRPDLVYRPVADASPYVLTLIWPADARSPAIARFVRTATDVATTESTDDSRRWPA